VTNGKLILIVLGGKMSESGVLGFKMFSVCLMSCSSLMGWSYITPAVFLRKIWIKCSKIWIKKMSTTERVTNIEIEKITLFYFYKF